MKEYLDLLIRWCDGLVEHQIMDIPVKGIHGGLICPACSAVHGRCFGAIHPLLYAASKTGNEKYIRTAQYLIDWSDHVSCPDGGFVNDTSNEWRGTTAFSTVALLKALSKYGSVLPEATRQKMLKKADGGLSFLYNHFDPCHGNINYLIGTAYALELGGKVRNNTSYRDKAKLYVQQFLTSITPNGLITGEGGKAWSEVSPKGCSPVDIGYNVEESLNFLVLYALSTKDEELLARSEEIALAHLYFALPDGGWDLSCSTRMDKWTYWGSRTSDGCMPAFIILGRRNGLLKEAALRNFEYMKVCTPDNLLYGGRDLPLQKEPPCIHHAFTHAEGLVTALEWLEDHPVPEGEDIKREGTFYEKDFEKYFPEMDTHLYSSSQWRATITGSDAGEKQLSHPSGGALSLLYHKNAGPLLVSSMTRYKRYEITNTQRHKNNKDTPLTPRIELTGTKTVYASILDRTAKVSRIGPGHYHASGRITDGMGGDPPQGRTEFESEYLFDEDKVILRYTLRYDGAADGWNPVAYIPLVSCENEQVTPVENGYAVKKDGFEVMITSPSGISLEQEERLFNHVPGFQALGFQVLLNSKAAEIKIKVVPSLALHDTI